MPGEIANRTPDITKAALKEVVPPHFKSIINDEMVDTLNSALENIEERRIFKDTLLGATATIANNPNISFDDYANACKFVTYLALDENQGKGLAKRAYARTFPDRFERLLLEKKPVDNYVSVYKRSKSVMLVTQAMSLPFHVLNMDKRQQALEVQATLMYSAKSEKVQSDAADSVLKHTAQPEESTTNILNLNTPETSELQSLKEALNNAAKTQQEIIRSGKSTALNVAESRIIDVDAERVE